jgi:hypothetical protein
MIQNISDAKKAFRLFGSKTKDILDSEYLNKLKATGSKLSINASKGKPVRFSRIGGSKDDLDLVLVRLRFFSLDRDGISFHVLSEVCNLEVKNGKIILTQLGVH